MDEVLRGLDFVYCYIDDLLIASSSPEEHLEHLRMVLKYLEEHGILINVILCTGAGHPWFSPLCYWDPPLTGNGAGSTGIPRGNSEHSLDW